MQAQAPTRLVGCVSQDANGFLRFEAQPSRRVYRLQTGEIDDLQRHINQQLAISGHPAGDNETGTFTVENFDVVSENCTSVPPSQDTSGVPGKVGQVEVATPVTSVGSANETTPGFQTEAGLQQAAGVAPSGTATRETARAPFGPSSPEQAGESSTSAELDAQAASRAELYPGTTLGVDFKSAPPSSVQASRQQTNLRTLAPE